MSQRTYFHTGKYGVEIVVPPNASSNEEYASIQAAMTYASTQATVASPWVVRLLPGLYDVTSVITCYSNVNLVGAGKDLTTIRRLTSLNNGTSRGSNSSDHTDPVIDYSDQENITVANLTVVHSGASTDSATLGNQYPVALLLTDAQTVTLDECRFESTATGVWAFGLDHQSEVLWSTPTYIWYLRNCEFIGHKFYGYTSVQRIVVATGCFFQADSTGQTYTNESGLAAYRNWEWNKSYLNDCIFHLNIGHTATAASNTKSGSITSIDTVNGFPTVIHAAACKFILEMSGDINSATYHASAAVIGGDFNKLYAQGCAFSYRTPTITSASSISGLILYAVSSGGTQEVYLDGCDFRDDGGSGGSTRKDLVLLKATAIDPAPDKLQLFGTRTSTTIGEAGGFTYNAGAVANLGITPASITRQVITDTFATAATKTFTLTLSYPTNCTDYTVSIEPSINETFWVTGKTNTQFTLNSSNAASTATVKCIVTR